MNTGRGIRHITAAVDFSSLSLAAARVAYAIARAHGADLTLLHAYERMEERHPAAAAIMPASVRDQLELGGTEEARDKLQHLSDELESGVPEPRPKIWCELADGIASETIPRAALEAAADLLVIGSRGKSQIASWLVGSIACEVAATAHCGVLVVKEASNNGWAGRFNAITIGVDGGELSAPLVSICQTLAGSDAELAVVNAGLLELGGADAEKLRDQLDGERFSVRIEGGPPVATLLHRATTSEADLIAVGSHARDTLDNRLLGTTAERVLRGANAPVLMLPTTSLPRVRTAVTGDMKVFVELNGGPCKTYLIASTTGEAMIIDPLFERVGEYVDEIHRRELELRFVIDTHVHADHLSGGPALAQRDKATYVVYESSGTTCEAVRVGEGDKLVLGQLEACVLHTPGHAQDAISLVFPDRILTGDSLFIGEAGAGRTDLPGSDPAEHWASLRKLHRLDGALLVFPGHDYNGFTFSTLAEERVNNPRFESRTRAAYVAWLGEQRLGPSEWMVEVIRANYACEQATTTIPEHLTSSSELGGDDR